jgi:8-oxo-dGTP pyrophosphatase MutT (NUDIX family)
MAADRPLRLGALAAVADGDRLLVVQRADFGYWTLPGGRLDRGETLAQAAVRELWEETGLRAEPVAAIGLYGIAGFGRVNALFALRRTGGRLAERAAEMRAARWVPFAEVAATPAPMPYRTIATDAARWFAHGALPPPRVLAEPGTRTLKARLAVRWAKNWLRGRPEHAFPAFEVCAVAVVRDAAGRILTVAAPREGGTWRALPTVTADGRLHAAPWAALERLCAAAGVAVGLRWAGMAEEAGHGRVLWVFTGTVGEALPEPPPPFGWSAARNAALLDAHARIVLRCAANGRAWPGTGQPDDRYLPDTPVWLALAHSGRYPHPGDILHLVPDETAR